MARGGGCALAPAARAGSADLVLGLVLVGDLLLLLLLLLLLRLQLARGGAP